MMIRWIMDNQRYNADYLAIPGTSDAAGRRAKLTNATHPSLRMNCRRLPDNTRRQAILRPMAKQTPVVLNTDGELVDVLLADRHGFS